jgi:hypothetical protein
MRGFQIDFTPVLLMLHVCIGIIGIGILGVGIGITVHERT